MVSNIQFSKPQNAKPNSKVIAEGSFILHEKVLLPFKLITGPRGPFVGYPSRKSGDTWVPIVDIIDREMRYAIQDAVLEAWNSK